MFVAGRISHYIDGKEDSTNWMKFVSCARYRDEQNLCLVQTGLNIFYEACADIRQGDELRVWYGDDYSLFMGIPIGLKANLATINGINEQGSLAQAVTRHSAKCQV